MTPRSAELKDLQGICDLLREFREDPVAPYYFSRSPEQTQLAERQIIQCLRDSFVIEADQQIIAAVLAHRGTVPFTLEPILEEVIWYVRPQYRGTSAGGRVFLAFKQHARELYQSGAVTAVLCHTMCDTPIDLEQHGYEPLQQTWRIV